MAIYERDKRWHEGTIGNPNNNEVAHYWVKAYEEGSIYGINEGKISKLQIKVNGKITCNYDRGWDIEPNENDETTQIALAILMYEYN